MTGKEVALFGIKISQLGLAETANLVTESVLSRKGLKVYCCTLNELMAADEDEDFKKILIKGDLRTADGMPLVWMLRRKTGEGGRVYGPDLMKLVLEKTLRKDIKHYFLGDKKNRHRLIYQLKKMYSGINIAGYEVLPIRNIFLEKDYGKINQKLEDSGASLVWVGLGGKKQIMVADELSRRFSDKVFITVGAAFDFLAKTKKQAPIWTQKIGLEWFFRLVTEPKRLGTRYLKILIFLGKKLFENRNGGN